MKVKIGNYCTYWGPYQVAELLFFWYPKKKDEFGNEENADFIHSFGKWLSVDKNGEDSWLYTFLNWIHSKKNRNVKVKIDRYDHWNAHNTASLILAPLFKSLREHTHSSGFIDDDDVPDRLKSTTADTQTQEEKDNGHSDSNFQLRYKWVLDEVIWALEQDNNEWEEQFYPKQIDGKYDWDGIKVYNKRIANGFRLMGLYWQNFWS